MIKRLKHLTARLTCHPSLWKGLVVGLWLGASLLLSCSYDEELPLLPLQVQVVYQQTSFEGPQDARVRVELKDQHAQLFVDSTAEDLTARFLVPPGIYEASTTASYVDTTGTTWWRYNFNGVRSMIVVTPDSMNKVEMTVRMSRKRVVH